MKFIFSIILICFLTNVHTQDLHIYYNLHKDSIWYEKNGKPTEKLTVRNGKQIHFHLVEYNNYLYHADIKTSIHSSLPPGYASSSNSFMGLVPSLINSIIPGGGAALPFMNMPVFGNLMGALSKQPASLFAGDSSTASRGDQEDLIAFKELLEKMETEKNEINADLTILNKQLRSANLLNTNLDFVNTISTQKNIAPSVIKDLLLNYFYDALGISEGQYFDIKSIAALNLELRSIPNTQSKLSTRISDYTKQMKELKRLETSLKNIDHGIDELYPLFKQYDQQETNMRNMINGLESSLASIQMDPMKDYTQSIQHFYIKYLEILNNDFKINHHTEAQSNYILYNLVIYEKDSNGLVTNTEEMSIFKEIELNISTHGNVKFGTSFGIQGASFSKVPQDYFLRNNVLEATDNDKYIPMVSSMININYQMNSTFSPALSVGVGVPLSNSDNLDRLSFFIGPSIMLGKSQDIVISGGFLFSKINRLAKGFNIGDTLIIGDGLIPTEKKFEGGYFLGISYNISK